VSGSGERSAHDSALPAPGDRDQTQQAGTEQPNRGRDRHRNVCAWLLTEREDDVGDNGAGGGAGKRQRPRRRGVDERVVRIIVGDRAIGIGVGSRSDNQCGGTSRGTGQRIQVIVIPRGVGQQTTADCRPEAIVVAYRDPISGRRLETPAPGGVPVVTHLAVGSELA